MFFLVFLALFVSSYIPVVKVFNLDIISPDLRTGPPKSLFGFAVVSSSVRQQWYGCSKKIIIWSKFYFVGLMLAHLELYLVVNDSHQFYQIVLIMSQMAVCLGIFSNVQMAQINVVRFLLRVIDWLTSRYSLCRVFFFYRWFIRSHAFIPYSTWWCLARRITHSHIRWFTCCT